MIKVMFAAIQALLLMTLPVFCSHFLSHPSVPNHEHLFFCPDFAYYDININMDVGETIPIERLSS